MLNKQRLHGWVDFLEFKAQYTRDQREAALEERKKIAARQKKVEENVTLGIQVMVTLLVVMAALFGVALYMRG